jgi:ribosomal RNA-processing protein 9
MPDSFFATKSRKRKRVTAKDTGGPSSSKKKVQKTSDGRRPAAGKGKARAADEDLHSDGSESVALEDMDLRADEVDPNESGDEDAGETSAQKRLRLAKLYLKSVREDLGAPLSPSFLIALGVLTLVSLGLADGEADAAEIDKELISARLKEDVLEHAGKLHLFVADSVSAPVVYDDCVRTAPHPHVV